MRSCSSYVKKNGGDLELYTLSIELVYVICSSLLVPLLFVDCSACLLDTGFMALCFVNLFC